MARSHLCQPGDVWQLLCLRRPQPSCDVLKQQLHFTDLDIGFLQAIYSFPNIFTVLIGGVLIDRIGLRKALMIFAVLSFVGPAITGGNGTSLGDGCRTADFRHGSGVAQCCGYDCAGALVPRERTQFCVWLESDSIAAGHVFRAELAYLGARGVCLVANSIS